MLFKSLILPNSDYGSIFHDEITDDLNNKLEKSRSACINFIFNLKKSYHISQYRARAGMLNISKKSQIFMKTFSTHFLSIRFLNIYLNN